MPLFRFLSLGEQKTMKRHLGRKLTIGYMRHSCIEMEDYSAAYFGLTAVFEVPYHWTSVDGQVHLLDIQASTKRVWALPLMEVQSYSALKHAAEFVMRLNYTVEQSSISTWDCHILCLYIRSLTVGCFYTLNIHCRQYNQLRPHIETVNWNSVWCKLFCASYKACVNYYLHKRSMYHSLHPAVHPMKCL